MNLLSVERLDGVAVLRLNDPARRNIVSLPLVAEIESAMSDLEAEDAVRAVIVTGAGSVFSAGADFADLDAARRGNSEGLKRIYRGFLRIAECPLPTIAAVNGPAVGAGMNLALACDLRVAAETAVFDTRFLTLGLHPGGGHTWMLNRAVGWQGAVAMLLLGLILNGREAAERGLALSCVPDDQLMPTAIQLASRAASFPIELLRRAKASMRRAIQGNDHADAVRLEYEQQLWALMQPEFRELLNVARAASSRSK